MDSAPPPPSSSAAAPPPPQEAETAAKREKEMAHRTKAVQFLGRTAPIILQNDNGPCPLLAICNVLSLKNSLNLSPDISEVSQEKLLSLVAERLIDSNSNIDDKDAGYLENQQQNIADAIDLLPRLTTGIDVNIKFRRIDDFEFTPECAIFDLLDIPLYHGWIVDPQDHETSDAIGAKSYNTLMGELVSLETQTMESGQEKEREDDSVDFVAATTAALGVPSPCLSRGQSFDESPQRARKGDIEEEAELLRIMKLSEVEKSGSALDVFDYNLVERTLEKPESVKHSETLEIVTDETVKTVASISDDNTALSNHNVDLKLPEVSRDEAASSFSRTDGENSPVQCTDEESVKCSESAADNAGCHPGIENENDQPVSLGENPPFSINLQDKPGNDDHVKNEQDASTSNLDQPINHPNGCKTSESSSPLTADAGLDSSSGKVHYVDKPEPFTSNFDGSEPIYEGEECIMQSRTVVSENQEPIYEGEVVLAGQVDRACAIDGDFNDRISVKQGEVIRNFMKNSASQLTIYGLFCLQDKVKERELCVFFRNNHFNTMFKYEGELYILATDQGYINQPDLVWEKLNEVNGDTLFMTGDFKVFKMDDHSNSSWDEQNALASTADYLAKMDNGPQSESSFNSDLQLAIALQQQEFEEQQQQQQQPQQPQRNSQQSGVSGGSRMVTGPQVSRSSAKYNSSSSSSKPDSKSKEKCIIM